MKQGIYSIPFEQYEQEEGISKHGLDALAISPLHHWAWYRNPERVKPKETPAKVLGNAIHVSILEPERFEKEYIQEPKPEEGKHLVTLEDYKKACRNNGLQVTGTKGVLSDRLTGAGYPHDRLWDYVYAFATKGKKVISQTDWRITKAITARVRKHPAASELLKLGFSEQSIFWTDPDTGVPCKGRLDWASSSIGHAGSESPYVLDLKSTTDASPEGFQRSITKYRYYIQAAMYVDGVRQITGWGDVPFVFAAWEKSAPYASALYYATPEMLEAGRQEYKRLLKIYAKCLESDTWPGYSQEIEPISLPENFKPASSLEVESDWLDEMEMG